MDVRAINRSWHANVGNDASILGGGQLLHSFRPGRSLHHGISAALQCGAHERPHRRLILNQKNRKERASMNCCRHRAASFAAAAAKADSEVWGRRTTKVLPDSWA